MNVCYININSIEELDVYSHISKYVEFDFDHFDQLEVESEFYSFPFPLKSDDGKPFLCTQGHFGQFTHFYPETCYAIDFRCDVGTKVISLGDGEVISVNDLKTVSGIHASNLFEWNSLMIKIDVSSMGKNSFVYVEYVHIKPHSARVKVGDKVKKGEIICESGDVGFCPEPHLHIQAHLEPNSESTTIKFYLLDSTSNEPFIPESGKYYR